MDIENKYGMFTMHTALHKMLLDFDAICRDNDIIYSLGFGSMLGAIREHGIIPWDDDIDIIINRDNYRRLEKALDNSETFVLERHTRNTLWLPRFRYKGKGRNQFDYELTIDVFIIDNVPETELGASLKLFSIRALQGMIKSSINLKKGTPIQKIASLVAFSAGRLMPLSLKFKLFDYISSISNEKKTRECSCYNVEFLYAGRKYDGRLLDEIIRVDFDGDEMPVSKYFDSYLTVLYGNWRTPPSKTDRVPKHS